MSEMESRVARALHKAHYERGRGIPPSWELVDKFELEMWMFSARAAIEAMREPTEAMIESARIYGETTASEVKTVWVDMIDEALK